MLAQEKSVIIVHDSKTKQCAELLCGLIGEKNDAGVPINAIIHDSKSFAALPAENKSAKQKILYIGDFKESKLLSKNIVKWQFNNFGFRYGWLGSKAVISFDKEPLSEEEFIEMAEYAEKTFKEYEINVRDKVDKNGLNPLTWIKRSPALNKKSGVGDWIIGIGAATVGLSAGVIGMGLIAADIIKDKDKLNPLQIKEQQQKFAVLHFLLFGINDFLGIKDDEN